MSRIVVMAFLGLGAMTNKVFGKAFERRVKCHVCIDSGLNGANLA